MLRRASIYVVAICESRDTIQKKVYSFDWRFCFPFICLLQTTSWNAAGRLRDRFLKRVPDRFSSEKNRREKSKEFNRVLRTREVLRTRFSHTNWARAGSRGPFEGGPLKAPPHLEPAASHSRSAEFHERQTTELWRATPGDSSLLVQESLDILIL